MQKKARVNGGGVQTRAKKGGLKLTSEKVNSSE